MASHHSQYIPENSYWFVNDEKFVRLLPLAMKILNKWSNVYAKKELLHVYIVGA